MQNLQESKKLFIEDLAEFDSAKVVTAKKMSDMLMDSDLNFGTQPQNYFLAEMGIPASYFKKTEDSNLQQEMLSHAVRQNPSSKVKYLQKKNKIKAAGPAIDFKMSSLKGILNEMPGKVTRIVGRISHGHNVRVFRRMDDFEIKKDGFETGFEFRVSPLFARGIQFYPSIMQMVCLNGMISTRNLEKTMSIKKEISEAAITYGVAAVAAMAETRADSYKNTLDLSTKHAAPNQIQMEAELKSNGFPKGYLNKMLGLYGRVIEGDIKGEPVPAKIESFFDTLSVMSYAAQYFTPATQANLEAKVWDYAEDTVRLLAA